MSPIASFVVRSAEADSNLLGGRLSAVGIHALFNLVLESFSHVFATRIQVNHPNEPKPQDQLNSQN
jgi:hypothetical protein